MGLVGGKAAGAWVTRQAVRRGLLGGSRLWFAAFVAQGAVKLARRAMAPRQPTTVLKEQLVPGAGIEIRHIRRDRG